MPFHDDSFYYVKHSLKNKTLKMKKFTISIGSEWWFTSLAKNFAIYFLRIETESRWLTKIEFPFLTDSLGFTNGDN